ncbi:putative ribonuclease H-like domain-containing protein [Tanacetum coccineum]|uniref:Ribonuclease H-like domain-containing protein n=1 Tax=Tanacetum coccineum TaxID=301880 RepID=A0ABQ5C454_9ASTR
MDLETTQTNAAAKLPLLKQGEYETEDPKKNDVKARSMLLMALPNEHLLTFNQYKDAKTLFNAIQARFSGNDATKKTQKTLLKQMNKPDLDSMSFDDLYNNFKIAEQEVKRTTSSNSSLNSQNMAFVSSPSGTNDVKTANVQVSTASSSVSTDSTQDSTANLSDATIYAILANQPNGPQLVHEDLEQILEDDLEEIELKWQLALLSMRARRYYHRTGKKITINGSDTAGYDKNKIQDSSRRIVNVEETSSKAMVAIDGAGFDWSFMAEEEVATNMALMAFSNSEFENASKCLDKLIGSQISDNSRKGVGYNAVPPPPTGLFAPPTIDLVQLGLEIVPQPVNTAKAKAVNTARPHSAVVNVVKDNQANVVKASASWSLMEDMLPLVEESEEEKSLVKMCDKKNYVLFTDTACFVLSPDFKLPDESQILLKIPRKNNMYSVDMKNIVPKESLTCLVAKATLDESMLWHRRLGHVNFKTINKLVKDNLVRVFIHVAYGLVWSNFC